MDRSKSNCLKGMINKGQNIIDETIERKQKKDEIEREGKTKRVNALRGIYKKIEMIFFYESMQYLPMVYVERVKHLLFW